MLVYHASNMTVENPVIMNRYTTLDFGTGFYTTTNEEQAREFALKTYFRRRRKGVPTVNAYWLDEAALGGLRVIRFEGPNSEWLHFVVHNRRHGRDPLLETDIVIGPVANDDVFATVSLFEAGEITEGEAIERFKVKRLFDQVLFCNERALGALSFEESYVLEIPERGR